jgi:hypothetical protein
VFSLQAYKYGILTTTIITAKWYFLSQLDYKNKAYPYDNRQHAFLHQFILLRACLTHQVAINAVVWQGRIQQF